MIKKENIRINVTLPRELYKKLKEDAEYEARSVGNMAAVIIKNYYEKKSSDEDTRKD